MNIKENHHHRPGRAFTLIEMLVVVAIMAIVAALVVNMGQSASQKKKITAVKGEMAKLTTMIGNYYARLNYYPPDNGALADSLATNVDSYDGWAATNPLIYELNGSTSPDNGSNLLVFNSTNSSCLLPAASYSNVFNRNGIANSDPAEPHNFFQPGPMHKEYSAYAPPPIATSPPICGLVVPADLGTNLVNFWHYDSSSTNRHNMGSYDLWAEISIGSQNGQLIILTNGNW